MKGGEEPMAYLLWHYLAASVRRHPERPAVAWRDVVLTYRELDDQSGRLASALSAHGVGRSTRVGVLMPKSHRSVVAMLGISKAGAAYVPVDPHAPIRRAAYILSDSAVKGLVTTARKLAELREIPEVLNSLEVVLLADDGEDLRAPLPGLPIQRWSDLAGLQAPKTVLPAAVETDPAYLLYTSGSTGNPKGVILSHRHALTFVDWASTAFAVSPEDRLANHAPLHFDLSVFDIYVALKCGACTVIVPDEVAPFPPELARWIAKERISVWYSVPSALVRLLLHGKLESFDDSRLRAVLFAGEVFAVKYLREIMRLWRHARFYNLYGPTETNVCTYFALPEQLEPDAVEIPIGQACANTEVFALDEDGRPVAEGETGELFIRGPSLMSGYWGQPEKTREALVPNPCQPSFHELVYRTGDLVRVDREGQYWFVGRRDHMVKSRGYRIELGEVEQILYQHSGVKEAVVVALRDDEIGARLHAVVVPQTPQVTQAELFAFCTARLPRFMLPETLRLDADLPKTSTGKIDRVAVSQRLALTPQEVNPS